MKAEQQTPQELLEELKESNKRINELTDKLLFKKKRSKKEKLFDILWELAFLVTPIIYVYHFEGFEFALLLAFVILILNIKELKYAS